MRSGIARSEPVGRQLAFRPAGLRQARRRVCREVRERKRRGPGESGARWTPRRKAALEPFDRGAAGENPFTVQCDLQDIDAESGGNRAHGKRNGGGAGQDRGVAARARPRPASPGIASTTPAGTRRSICDNLLTISEMVAIAGAGAQREPRRALPRRLSGQERGVGQIQSEDRRRVRTAQPKVERMPVCPLTDEMKKCIEENKVNEHGDVPNLARRTGRGKFVDYNTEYEAGMVVLDVVHRIQAAQANDMAVRWNCKAGKCGSCSAEINGKPRLMCMTRLNQIDLDAAGDRGADEDVSARQGSGHRCFLELRSQEKDPEIQAAQTGCSGWNLARAAGRRRSSPGIPQVHRVLPVPGCVPRACATTTCTTSSSVRDS